MTLPQVTGSPHLGSSLDALLDEESTRAELEARAIEEVRAWQHRQATDAPPTTPPESPAAP